MKSFFLLSFLAFSFQTFAQVKSNQLCVVISGAKHEGNQFLEDKIFHTGANVGSMNCKVFDSWVSAKKHIHSSLNKDGKLLLIQGAHGGRDGTYEVNDTSVPVTSESIYKDLKELSKDYQVGSVIHSCYSGSIMKLKLMDDEKSDEGLERLCLVTSASFGRVTYSRTDDVVQNLLKSKPGDSLEKAFLDNTSGTISSAAWSEINIPEYLMNTTAELGVKTLQGLNQIVSGDYTCSDQQIASAALCAAPNVSSKEFQDFMRFMDHSAPSATKKEFIEMINVRIEKTKSSSEDGYECYSELKKHYQTIYGEKLQRDITWVNLQSFMEQLKKEPFYPTCLNYQQGLQGPSKDLLFLLSFYDGLESYKKSVDDLQKKYSNKKFNGDFDLFSFTDAALGEKAVCKPQSKEGILQSMFGELLFSSEYKTLSTGSVVPDPYIVDINISTQNALKGFQNASIVKKEMPHPKDQKRREACRNFKI